MAEVLEDGSVVIDRTMPADEAVAAYRAARQRVMDAYNAEAMTTDRAAYRAASAELNASTAEQKATRTQAQYAIKQVTGFYPYELALMGL